MENNKQTKKYYKTFEVAKRLGYSDGYVSKQARNGLFGEVKVGKGRWLFTEDNIQFFISKREPLGTPKSAHQSRHLTNYKDPKFAFDANDVEGVQTAPSSPVVNAVPVDNKPPYIASSVSNVDTQSQQLAYRFKNDENAAKVARLCAITNLPAEKIIATALDMLLQSEKVKNLIEAYELFETERKGFEL